MRHNSADPLLLKVPKKDIVWMSHMDAAVKLPDEWKTLAGTEGCGQVAVRPLMAVNLSVDHRAASGADGARLLQTVTRYLEHPLLLLV